MYESFAALAATTSSRMSKKARRTLEGAMEESLTAVIGFNMTWGSTALATHPQTSTRKARIPHVFVRPRDAKAIIASSFVRGVRNRSVVGSGNFVALKGPRDMWSFTLIVTAWTCVWMKHSDGLQQDVPIMQLHATAADNIRDSSSKPTSTRIWHWPSYRN